MMHSSEGDLTLLPADQRLRAENLLAEFDESWSENGLATSVARLPPPGDPFRAAVLAELVKIDLERQWRLGRRAMVEAYLVRYPDLGTREGVPLGLLAAEVRARRLVGSEVDRDELTRRFPALAGRLDDLLETTDSGRGGGSATDHGAAPSAVVAPPSAPLFGRYEVKRRLGAGAMGTVYLVRDTQLDRAVALKVPKLGAEKPEAVARFQREARAAAALKHANICTIHDVNTGTVAQSGRERTVPYLTMEYVEGQPLSRLLKHTKGGLPAERAAGLTATLARALQVAHDAGVIHRDLKPANVMVRPDGQPVLMDFGLARRDRDARITRGGSAVGTPAYMAPEQIGDRNVGPAADIYALGVLFYELLTGALPYDADGAINMLAQVLTREPTPPSVRRPGLDPRLETVCLRAMAKDPAQRFASMSDFAEALERLAAMPVKPPPRRRSRGVAFVAAAALLAIVLGAAVLSLRTSEGTLTVQVHDPEVTVEVDGNALRVNGGPVPMKAGPHALAVRVGGVAVPLSGSGEVKVGERKLTLKLDGAELRGDSLVFERGGRAALEIRLTALPPAPAPVVAVGGAPTVSESTVLAALQGEWQATLSLGWSGIRVVRGRLVHQMNTDTGRVAETGSVRVQGSSVFVTFANGRQEKLVFDPEQSTRLDGAAPHANQSIRWTQRRKGPPTPRGEAVYANALGMHFTRIPPGQAWLGGDVNYEGPREVVFANEFYLGTYEVTQAEWRRVLNKSPSHFARGGAGKDAVRDLPDDHLEEFPVEAVSWLDCQEFVRRLNELLPEPGWEYRLPTEDEWEYACRAGPHAHRGESKFNFYFDTPQNHAHGGAANYRASGLGRPCRVGSYPPNRLGLCDMHGNVWELCQDTAVRDIQAGSCVGRGCSWLDDLHAVRFARSGPPLRRLDAGPNIGLRLTRVPKPLPPPMPALAPGAEERIRAAFVLVRVTGEQRQSLGLVTELGVGAIMPGSFQEVDLSTLDGKALGRGTVGGRRPFPFCWIDAPGMKVPRSPYAPGGGSAAQSVFIARFDGRRVTMVSARLELSGALAVSTPVLPEQAGVVAVGPVFALDGTCLGLSLRADKGRPIELYPLKRGG